MTALVVSASFLRSAVTVPTPTPTPASTLNPNDVTPGLVGFIAIFLIAVAVILLMVDMVRRIRRLRYRGEIAAKLDAEEAERAALEADRPALTVHEAQPPLIARETKPPITGGKQP